MRKDVKTGLLIGTGLCLVVAVWFCMHQQVVEQPRMELLFPKDNSQADTSPQTIPIKAEKQVYIGKNQPAPQPPSSAPAVKTDTLLRIHIVQPSQTLSDISKIYYGTPGNWKKIYEANKESLPNGPDTIRMGMKLAIPE
jgi:hypothetical protein